MQYSAYSYFLPARASGMIAALGAANAGGSLESPIAMSHSERIGQKAAERNRPSAPEAHRQSDRAYHLQTCFPLASSASPHLDHLYVINSTPPVSGDTLNDR
jgi:hypothetical protein